MEQSPNSRRSLRSELIILLSQAGELEHSLACAYFFCAYSLKQSLEEGITRRQLDLTNRWAEDLLNVAHGKILHFAQVWNLFSAFGCNPYHWRPNFPIPSKYYPIDLSLELLPFGSVAIDRWLHAEVPDQGVGSVEEENCLTDDSLRVSPKYRSVAQLYSVLYRIIESIPEEELFIGHQERQVGPLFPDFSSLIQVVDRESAFRAIDILRGKRTTDSPHGEQPESRLNRNRHYEVLRRLQDEYRDEQRRAKLASERFELVRAVLPNPVLVEGVDYRVPIITQPQAERAVVGRLIQNPYTREVALLFEDVYSVMLSLLQYVFRKKSNECLALQIFSETAMGLIPSVLKPLGESLMLLPAGAAWEQQKSGPTFGMSRYKPLPPDPSEAMMTVQSRLHKLIIHATELTKDDQVTAQLMLARRNLEDCRDRLRDGFRNFAVNKAHEEMLY